MIRWMRRRGGQRVAHAVIDGHVLCWAGRIPAGTVTPDGHVVSELAAAELAPSGLPFGQVCEMCTRYVQQKGAA